MAILHSPEKLAAKKRLSWHSVQSWTFGGGTRYLILVLSTICLSLVVSNASTLNFTIICMKQGDTLWDNDEDDHSVFFESIINSSNSSSNVEPEPMFTVWQEGWLFSAVAVGTLFGTLPIAYITSRFGTRWMFTLYGLITAIATIFAPFVIMSGGFFAFLGIRFLQGVAMATSYVAMGSISSEWSPLRQSGLFLCVISCHLQIGPILLMPIAGELCASQFGWPFVYYGFGVATLFAFVLFFAFYRDSPHLHSNVSIKERMIIDEGKCRESDEESNGQGAEEPSQKAKNQRRRSSAVPYKRMVLDTFVWVILLVQIGSSLGLQVFTMYGPVYLNKALGMEVTKTGFSAALPHLLSVLLKLVAGPISDRLTWISEKSRIIFFASVSQYLMAGCFVAMVVLPSDNLILNQICFTLVTMFSGLNTVGVTKCIQMTSRHFSHVIFSGRTFVNSLVIILLPVLVSEMAPDGTVSQWARIFVVIAVALAVTTTLFDFYAEVEPREWARSNNSRDSIQSQGPVKKNGSPLERNCWAHPPQSKTDGASTKGATAGIVFPENYGAISTISGAADTNQPERNQSQMDAKKSLTPERNQFGEFP